MRSSWHARVCWVEGRGQMSMAETSSAPCWLWGCVEWCSMFPGHLSPLDGDRKQSPRPWSAGCLQLPVVQMLASSFRGSSQRPFVPKKSSIREPTPVEWSTQKAYTVVEWLKCNVNVPRAQRKVRDTKDNRSRCPLLSYLRFEAVTSNRLCLTMQRKRLGAV